MAYNERDAAIAVQQRLDLPVSKVLAIQSLVPAALANLAKSVANDPMRRQLLMTPQSTTSVNFGDGNPTPQADLSTLIANDNILLEKIKYGTTWLRYGFSFDDTDVTSGTYPTGGYITLDTGTAIITGTAVYLTAGGTLPSGLTGNTTYYAIVSNGKVYFAETYDEAINNRAISLGSVGSGTNTLTTVPQVVQWLGSPNQGMLTSCLTINYPTAWIEGTRIYSNTIFTTAASCTLSFSVPYVPTIDDFPNDSPLYSDLLDELTAIAVTKDLAEPQNNQ